MKIIFKHATVVSSRNKKEVDVFVEDGKIVESFVGKADRTIDCAGKLLLPGAIDCHVHFREPGGSQKEDWVTGSKAAVMGGVTTVLDMPNNNPPILTQADLVAKRKLVLGRSYVNYGFFVGASVDTDALLKIEGAVGIKLYMGSSTGDLLVDDEELWEKIFAIAKKKNLPVTVHAENEARIKRRMAELSGDTEACAYARARDSECAREATEMALNLRKRIGNQLHIAHLSSKAELELMKEFRNPKLTCEVAPHHLFFTMEDMEDAFLKMNPPLRTFMDLEALWRGLNDGTISCIATDHAPHTSEEKSADVWTAPAGVPGVQFVLPLMLHSVNEGKLSIEKLVELMCENPAKIYNLKGKGKVAPGFDADLVLIDMDKEATITRKQVLSKCGWSPYEYFTLQGWPVLTMVNGEVVMEKEKICGKQIGVEVEL